MDIISYRFQFVCSHFAAYMIHACCRTSLCGRALVRDMGGARGLAGGQLPPVPSYLPRLPPTWQNNYFRCPTGVFNFFL